MAELIYGTKIGYNVIRIQRNRVGMVKLSHFPVYNQLDRELRNLGNG